MCCPVISARIVVHVVDLLTKHFTKYIHMPIWVRNFHQIQTLFRHIYIYIYILFMYLRHDYECPIMIMLMSCIIS